MQIVYLGAAAQALLQLRLQNAQQFDEEVGLRMQRCALASQRQLHDLLPLREACRAATIGMLFMGIVIIVQSVRQLQYKADWTQLSIRQAAVCTARLCVNEALRSTTLCCQGCFQVPGAHKIGRWV